VNGCNGCICIHISENRAKIRGSYTLPAESSNGPPRGPAAAERSGASRVHDVRSASAEMRARSEEDPGWPGGGGGGAVRRSSNSSAMLVS